MYQSVGTLEDAIDKLLVQRPALVAAAPPDGQQEDDDGESALVAGCDSHSSAHDALSQFDALRQALRSQKSSMETSLVMLRNSASNGAFSMQLGKPVHSTRNKLWMSVRKSVPLRILRGVSQTESGRKINDQLHLVY
jgi:hypothetical protein